MNVIQDALVAILILFLSGLWVLALLYTVDKIPDRFERPVEILGKVAASPFHIASVVLVGGLLFVIFAPLFAIALPFWFLFNIGEIAEEISALGRNGTGDSASAEVQEESEDEGTDGWIDWFFNGELLD